MDKKVTKSEIDINIKDLLWEMVRRWRVLIVTGIVFAVLLAGYQYQSDMKASNVVTVKKTQEEIESQMGDQDFDDVLGAVALKNQMDQKSDYIANSTLMQINPYAEDAVFMEYYVAVTEETDGTAIVDAYKAFVENQVITSYLTEESTDARTVSNIGEQVSIVKDSANIYVNAEDANESVLMSIQSEKEGYSFTIKVCDVNADSCVALANKVKQAVNEYTGTLKGILGTHELKLVSENQTIVVDTELAEFQNRNSTAIKTMGNNLDKMKTEMTSDQIALYVYKTTVQENNQTTSETVVTNTSVSISKKMLVIGAIVGIILACFYAVGMYLITGKLRTSEEVKTLYRIKVLGDITNNNGKKRIFAGIDRLIDKWQHHGKKRLTYEQEIQMIAANILINAQGKSIEKVYVSGSEIERISDTTLNDIISKCSEKGIQVEKGSALAYDAEALEQAAEVGNVVFIETKRKSLYDEIYKEIVLCNENQIHIMGMIVLGE